MMQSGSGPHTNDNPNEMTTAKAFNFFAMHQGQHRKAEVVSSIQQ